MAVPYVGPTLSGLLAPPQSLPLSTPLPQVGAPTLGGMYQPAGGRLAGLAGRISMPQMSAPQMPRIPSQMPRLGGTQVSPGYPGTRAALGRLGLGLGIQYGGSAITDQLGDTAAGNITGAMTAGGTIGSAFGAPGAAVGATGLGLGEGITQALGAAPGPVGDFYDNRSVTNVAENVGRKLNGPGSIGNALGAGVDPVALVKAMRTGDENAAVLAIADAYGIKPDENGDITLTGEANDAILAAREATHDPEDDPMGRLLYDLATTNASDEKIQATLDTYAAMLAENPELEPEAAVSQAQDYVSQQEEAIAAEAAAAETQMAEIAAFQAQAQQYMAPVTGQMRQRADQSYQAAEQWLGAMGLPAGMSESMLMQLDAQRQQQVALADAYDRQIAITPQMIMQQQAIERNQAIAAQLQQQSDAAMISGYMNPMAGATGGGLDLASLGIDPSMAALLPTG